MTRTRDLSLYTLASIEGGYLITKYDASGIEVLSQYTLSGSPPDLACACPQGLKPSCRHRKMFPMMAAIVDKPFFFCYDTGETSKMQEVEDVGEYDQDIDHLVGPGDDNGAAKPYEDIEGPEITATDIDDRFAEQAKRPQLGDALIGVVVNKTFETAKEKGLIERAAPTQLVEPLAPKPLRRL